jgi:hypothetical protein
MSISGELDYLTASRLRAGLEDARWNTASA